MLFTPSGKGRKREEKVEKGRFRPIPGKGGQTPLKPPFVTGRGGGGVVREKENH